MSYVLTLLQRFEIYMQDEDAFYAIFELIPTPYQYQTILSLLQVEPLLEKGNIRNGIKRRGCIKIENNSIICIDKNNVKNILCVLPKPFDL